MADQSRVAWLRGEVETWAREGLIAPAQAESLRSRYPLVEAKPAWSVTLFACLGAVIAGLGVILLFAYNWDRIPRLGKLTIAGLALLAAHGGGVLVRARRRDSGGGLAEGLHLLGTMLFGAGVWLVAQAYHIGEHYPNAFLVWALGALALGLALASSAQLVLGALLLVVWAGVERIAFDTPMSAALILLLAVVMPCAWRWRSRLLAGVAAPLSILSLLFAMPDEAFDGGVVIVSLMGLAALMVALAEWGRDRDAGGGAVFAGPFAVCGWGLYGVALYLLTFPALAEELLDLDARHLAWPVWGFWGAPLVGALMGWGAVLARPAMRARLVGATSSLGVAVYLVPLTLLLALVYLAFGETWDGGWTIAAPFNLVALGICGTLIARGCAGASGRRTVTGSLLLILIVTARYFDLFDSLLVRGLVFVGIGLLLFAESVLYGRARRRKGAPL